MGVRGSPLKGKCETLRSHVAPHNRSRQMCSFISERGYLSVCSFLGPKSWKKFLSRFGGAFVFLDGVISCQTLSSRKQVHKCWYPLFVIVHTSPLALLWETYHSAVASCLQHSLTEHLFSASENIINVLLKNSCVLIFAFIHNKVWTPTVHYYAWNYSHPVSGESPAFWQHLPDIRIQEKFAFRPFCQKGFLT